MQSSPCLHLETENRTSQSEEGLEQARSKRVSLGGVQMISKDAA